MEDETVRKDESGRCSSIKRIYMPDYELDYLESKPDRTAAAYSRPETKEHSPECFHEFVDLTAVWHDKMEQFDDYRPILKEMDNGRFEIYDMMTHDFSKDPIPMYSFPDWDTRHMKRWAYLDELIPIKLHK